MFSEVSPSFFFPEWKLVFLIDNTCAKKKPNFSKWFIPFLFSIVFDPTYRWKQNGQKECKLRTNAETPACLKSYATRNDLKHDFELCACNCTPRDCLWTFLDNKAIFAHGRCSFVVCERLHCDVSGVFLFQENCTCNYKSCSRGNNDLMDGWAPGQLTALSLSQKVMSF